MPRDGSATRQRILDTAERLVIDNGFAATSVDQVIAESGTSKGAFFHHFDSKTALARALVDRYAAADIGHLERAVAQVEAATDDPAARVIAFLRVFEDGADELMAAQSSCLYVSVLTERQLASSGTWDQITRAVLAWRAELARLLDDALAARPDAIPVDTSALADHVFVTFEGAFVLARSMNDAGHMRAQLRVLRQLLKALLAPRPTGTGQGKTPQTIAITSL
ncbi:MAG TPA: TetR/AcrR family transcriptional regulator [Streptosporangiaceae bacterium]|jgi:TetR/AcrR family transcriptional repressor of nem operon